jgi:hypothetical protein
MQISKDSWHFRLVAQRSERNYYTGEKMVPSNLCPYMRRLMWAMLVNVSKWVGIVLGVTLAASILAAPILHLVHSFIVPFLPAAWLVEPKDSTTVFLFMSLLGSVIYALAVLVVMFWAGAETKERVENTDWYRERRTAKLALPPKQPSIFVEWYRNWHDKTCSALEFVDTPAEA